jgi:transposase
METRETITLDRRAQQRLYVLNHVLAQELTVEAAAQVLELSIRQTRRLVERYRSAGVGGLVHGNRGRVPANRLDDATRARVVELAQTTYAGFNPVHLAETLAEETDELGLSARTIRRILAAGGIAATRTRRPPRHRSRRERMPREGLLLQVDGSRHDWLEGRGPVLTLVGGIDDATSRVTGGIFREQEDAAGYLITLTQTADRFGLPGALYSDLHGIFVKDPNRPPTLAEQLTGRRSLTQVGRALDDAGIAWIGAHSPQAKGRVERVWGTLQDRLVSELRRRRAATIEEANEVLAAYLPRHNRRFAVPAAIEEPAWRAWADGLVAASVFAFHYPRKVARDATISWDGVPLALPRRRDGQSWAGRVVTLEERLDSSLWVNHEGLCYPLAPAPPEPRTLRVRHLRRPSPEAPDQPPPPAAPASPSSGPVKPASTHPWRRYPAVRRP